LPHCGAILGILYLWVLGAPDCGDTGYQESQWCLTGFMTRPQLTSTPMGPVFAALRELVEAEERRLDNAGWARVQRAERRARAECEALGIRWPDTLGVCRSATSDRRERVHGRL
jgi:hypothetical protein